MTLEQIRNSLPDWAKDLKLNLQNALTTPGMTPRQIWGTALATAIAARNGRLLRAIAAQAADHLTPAEADAARMAASLMAMNNIYYRFLHLVHTPEYKTMPAKLRMTGIANHGTDPVDFELWSLAVSAVTGCGMCLESHEKALLERGASKELIQNAVRIAAIVHAGAVTLDAIAAEGGATG